MTELGWDIIRVEKIPDNKDKIDKILTELDIHEDAYPIIRKEILDHPLYTLIINRLARIVSLEKGFLTDYSISLIFQTARELAIIESPIQPDLSRHLYQKYIENHTIHQKWGINEIERQYLNVHHLRRKYPSIYPKTRYTKGEVYVMLNLLMECHVIYVYHVWDLFKNSQKGEVNSYFRRGKKVTVELVY